MLKIINKKIYTIPLISLFFVGVYVNGATKDYTVLAPLPGTTKGNCVISKPDDQNCEATLGGEDGYLQGILNLSIGLGAVTAFMMITINGFKYMLSDTVSVKINSKEYAQNALWGMAIVILAYAIMNTLDSRFVNGSINLTLPSFKPGSGINDVKNPCADTSSQSCTDEKTVLHELKQSSDGKISLNRECTPTSCLTQLGNLTDSTKSGVVHIQYKCNCNIVITGGDELGPHKSDGNHPIGKALDISPSEQLNKTFGKENPKDKDSVEIYIGSKKIGKATFESSGSGSSTGDHWHIDFI